MWEVANSNSRGAIRLESTQIRWFLWWPGREAGLSWGGGQRHSKLSLISRGHHLDSTQIRWFSWWPGREAGDQWPKTLKGKLMSSFRQPGDQLKWAGWQPERKAQLTLSQGMLKRWDVADEDDEVRTTIATDPCGRWGQKNLLFEPSFYSQIWPPKLLLHVGGGGRKYVDGHCRNSDPQPDLHKWSNQNRTSNYFVAGDDKNSQIYHIPCKTFPLWNQRKIIYGQKVN